MPTQPTKRVPGKSSKPKKPPAPPPETAERAAERMMGVIDDDHFASAKVLARESHDFYFALSQLCEERALGLAEEHGLEDEDGEEGEDEPEDSLEAREDEVEDDGHA